MLCCDWKACFVVTGFILFADETAAALALASMHGAELCGTDNCTHIAVELGHSQSSTEELASQRLLSRLQAAKRELSLAKRFDEEEVRILPAPLTGHPLSTRTITLHSDATSSGEPKNCETKNRVTFKNITTNLPIVDLVAQGKAIGPDAEDVNARFHEFLHGFRSLLPKSDPTAHPSLSNISDLGLQPSPNSAPSTYLLRQGTDATRTLPDATRMQPQGKHEPRMSKQGNKRIGPGSGGVDGHGKQGKGARGRGGLRRVRRRGAQGGDARSGPRG
jgi:hypothetical protein